MTAFLAASRSRLSMRAKRCMAPIPKARASPSQASSFAVLPLRKTLRKRIASCRIVMKLADGCFNARTFADSAGVNTTRGVMHREAVTIGEICQPVAGSIARFSLVSG